MATRKFKINPHALLFSCFKDFSARDFNMSVLRHAHRQVSGNSL